jgi:ABC-type antimicrobial peptide transport system permease subunit
MAIRRVLGATPRTIIWLFLNQARRSGIAGVVLGLVLSIAVAGALRGSLIAVRVFEPRMFLSAAGILLAVVVVAAYVPARRASRTDPGVILRQN